MDRHSGKELSAFEADRRRTVDAYHSAMRPLPDIRRDRLRQLIREMAGGNAAAFGRLIDKDRRQMSAWLREPDKPGAKNLSHDSAREIEANCLKPSGWLDTQPEGASNDPALSQQVSHFAGIDPDILHEAETLVLSDELQVGKKYPPRERARRLAQAYALLLSEGGRLSAPANARFVDSVGERHAGGEGSGEEKDVKRRSRTGTRAP